MTVKVEVDEVFDGLPGAKGRNILRPHKAPETQQDFNIQENGCECCRHFADISRTETLPKWLG